MHAKVNLSANAMYACKGKLSANAMQHTFPVAGPPEFREREREGEREGEREREIERERVREHGRNHISCAFVATAPRDPQLAYGCRNMYTQHTLAAGSGGRLSSLVSKAESGLFAAPLP